MRLMEENKQSNEDKLKKEFKQEFNKLENKIEMEKKELEKSDTWRKRYDTLLKDTIDQILGQKYSQKRYTFFPKKSQKPNASIFFDKHTMEIKNKVQQQVQTYKCDLEKAQFFLNGKEEGPQIIPEMITLLNQLMQKVRTGSETIKLEKK